MHNMAFERVSTEETLTGKFRKEKAWKLISDYTSYPDFMENVDAVKIHEKNEKEGISEWFVTIEEAPLRWVEKDYYEKEDFEVRFESIEGDFDNINGRWKIETVINEGIRISFTVDYNLGIPVIEEVLGHILKEKMKSNIDSMIQAVKNTLAKEEIEERVSQRFYLGTHHNITINGNSIRATVLNFSQGGMMIKYDGKLDPLSASVKINGNIIDSEIILHDLKRKNYRIIFKDILTEEDTDKLVKILSHEPQQVQEAVIVENEYVSPSAQETEKEVLIKAE